MLDIKLIREQPDTIRQALHDRHDPHDVASLLERDKKRRMLIAETDALKEKSNRAAQSIARMKQQKQDARAAIEEMQGVKKQIKEKDELLAHIEQDCTRLLLEYPNIPDASVPVGASEKENKVLRQEGSFQEPGFPLKDHVDIGTALGILDLDRAAKLSGARFPLLKNQGALLERALIRFMLDLHTTEHGYTEILPPFMVTPQSMQGTGQLPKFQEELFYCERDQLYLIPTAEVPLTGIHGDEILNEKDLPIKYVAYTPCFRREAGSYGKDTRGLIRNHQFNKVELVKLVRLESGIAELESLLKDAEAVLKKLGFSYRVLELCTGDLGFASAKTYDLEVWMPGEKRYREVSSCSLFTDFQARRLGIRYKDAGKKNRFVFTLNASGLAVGRIFAAILENGQQKDGSVALPKSLHSYMGCDRITRAQGAV
ncbi:MAG: serine--tRNA ligase [Elusimicrobia bacterium]|nr:serine--tRNA ligase [Elusimicrobiota bacterium]MBD3411986.1 serine--tRNA ligase [Elusimicrobiota bacterium]